MNGTAVLLRFEFSAGRFGDIYLTPFRLYGSAGHWGNEFQAFWLSAAGRAFPKLGKLVLCRVVDHAPVNEMRLAPTVHITKWTVCEICNALARKFPHLREHAEAMAK